MIFRRAFDSEAALVLQIYEKARTAGSNSGTCDWSSDYPNSQILKTDISLQRVFVLAEDDAIVACVTLLETDDLDSQPLGWRNVKSCVPVRLCVSPEWQNQGIAKIVMNHLIHHSRNLGYQSLRLLAHVGNPAANKLYRSLGFENKGMVFLYEKEFYAYEYLIPNEF